MLNIKILGSNCKRCTQLEGNVKDAIFELGIDANIIKLTELSEILQYGIALTPGLVVNEKLISFGSVLSVEELKKIFTLE